MSILVTINHIEWLQICWIIPGIFFYFHVPDIPIYQNENRNGQVNTNSHPRGYIISHLSYSDEDYANNINSSMTLIDLEANQRIIINFSDFEMYHIVGGVCCCENDYLQVSGLSMLSIPNVTYQVADDGVKVCSDTGRAPPIGQDITLTVKRDQITFKFVTDSIPRTRDDGFKLSYEGESVDVMNDS